MTDITLYWGEDALLGLESLGHADYDDEGFDIVCASVSALVHALLLGLSDVACVKDLSCSVLKDSEEPSIEVFWPEHEAKRLDILTRTVALSLKDIESGYPGHVRITEVQL